MLARTPNTAEDYFARAAANRALDEEAQRTAVEAHDKALWDWLGDRHAAMLDPENSRSSVFELTLTIIGKTAEAVEAIKADYLTSYPNHVYLTRFGKVREWHLGFRMTGDRRQQI